MNVKETKKTEDGKKIVFTCEADAEEFRAAINKVYRREVKKMNVPGFRKGKAPLHMIERMYGEGIFYEDAMNDLLPDAYKEAAENCGEKLVGYPEVNVVRAGKDGFEVEFITALRPQLQLKQYKGIEGHRHERAVGDEDVQRELDRLAQRQARTVTVEDRAAELGDTACIAYEGSIDGVPFEGGKSDDYDLKLGSHSFIDGFEDQIVGHKAGDEFDVNVTFPEQYHAEELAGKPAVFKVKIHGLTRTELPAIDDEFAKDVSEFDTLEELKKDILDRLTKDAKEEADKAFENSLVDAISETVEEEIPAAMVDSYVEDNLNAFQNNLAQQGLGLDMYLKYTGQDIDKMREQLRPAAERQAKSRLVLEAVAKAEDIQVSEEELEKEYEKFHEMYDMSVEELKNIISADTVADDIRCQKALDVIRENGVPCSHEHEEEESHEEE